MLIKRVFSICAFLKFTDVRLLSIHFVSLKDAPVKSEFISEVSRIVAPENLVPWKLHSEKLVFSMVWGIDAFEKFTSLKRALSNENPNSAFEKLLSVTTDCLKEILPSFVDSKSA